MKYFVNLTGDVANNTGSTNYNPTPPPAILYEEVNMTKCQDVKIYCRQHTYHGVPYSLNEQLRVLFIE